MSLHILCPFHNINPRRINPTVAENVCTFQIGNWRRRRKQAIASRTVPCERTNTHQQTNETASVQRLREIKEWRQPHAATKDRCRAPERNIHHVTETKKLVAPFLIIRVRSSEFNVSVVRFVTGYEVNSGHVSPST